MCEFVFPYFIASAGFLFSGLIDGSGVIISTDFFFVIVAFSVSNLIVNKMLFREADVVSDSSSKDL